MQKRRIEWRQRVRSPPASSIPSSRCSPFVFQGHRFLSFSHFFIVDDLCCAKIHCFPLFVSAENCQTKYFAIRNILVPETNENSSPQAAGLEFVQTRGRQGYYMSTRRIKPNDGPKRTPLANLFPRTVQRVEEEDEKPKVSTQIREESISSL